jgi:hypothetical protein
VSDQLRNLVAAIHSAGCCAILYEAQRQRVAALAREVKRRAFILSQYQHLEFARAFCDRAGNAVPNWDLVGLN